VTGVGLYATIGAAPGAAPCKALQWDGESIDEMRAFAGEFVEDSTAGTWIETAHGQVRLEPEDWVVECAENDFIVIEPAVFAATHAPVRAMGEGSAAASSSTCSTVKRALPA
jgi:hypothetical protein